MQLYDQVSKLAEDDEGMDCLLAVFLFARLLGKDAQVGDCSGVGG